MLASCKDRVVIVGAGIAGLVAAFALAARGLDVTLVERAPLPGGKMREIDIGPTRIDSGPTVFTMRWVFDELFAQAGLDFADAVSLRPLNVLARHAWDDNARFDLFADDRQTVDAIGAFAGAGEARRYRNFCTDSRRIFQILEKPFLRSSRPSMTSLIGSNGFRGLVDLPRIKPFTSMWNALGRYFHDPRLRQLFARYATYCGSSPFDAPATLMLVAHVERDGVWSIDGGMQKLATALVAIASSRGVRFRFNETVTGVLTQNGKVSGVALAGGEQIPASFVIMNADVSAIAGGLFGDDIADAAPGIPVKARSLSAMTWSIVANTRGFPLSRHSVFFSRDYKAEFEALFCRSEMPNEPTVYVCAQDRDDDAIVSPGSERLFVLINAPPIGDHHTFSSEEIDRCAQRTFGMLARCGLKIQHRSRTTQVTTPTDFNNLFPATGGALYGRSSHGWMASFQRPGARTKIPGLYLAGGSTHPGPGVPMAALSGRAAASSLLEDLNSMSRSRTMAMPGGMSTH